MRAQLSNRDYEQLSAYIDGQLAPRERERLEARLRLQPELQTALEDLNRTRSMLRRAPRRKAPRNFTLTPEMAEQIRPQRRKTSWNLFPALSFASALATLILVASFVFEMLPGTASTAMKSAQPQIATDQQAEPQRSMNKAQEGAPAAPEAPQSEAGSARSAAGAEPTGTPAPTTAAALAAQPSTGNQAAGSADQLPPPVVAWGGNPPYSGMSGSGGMGGGGGDGSAIGMGGGGGVPSSGNLLGPPVAPPVYGKEGAGAAGTIINGPQVYANGAPVNSLVLPQESVNSLNDTAKGATVQPVQPNPSIQGSGPILGVPEKDQGGQIVDQKALLGQPDSATPPAEGQPVTAPAPTLSPTAENLPGAVESQPAAPARPVSLPVIQGLLALIAVITGVAAILLWRNRG
jgi:hypothetical protein